MSDYNAIISTLNDEIRKHLSIALTAREDVIRRDHVNIADRLAEAAALIGTLCNPEQITRSRPTVLI